MTALLPYFVIFVLLIRGTTLDGASDGIRYYLSPDWEKLKSLQVSYQAYFRLHPLVVIPGLDRCRHSNILLTWTRLRNPTGTLFLQQVSQQLLQVQFEVCNLISKQNKKNLFCRDAIFTSCVNCLTSFVAGFVTFSVLGYMAKKLNKDISKVATDGREFENHNQVDSNLSFPGPGLVFIVYPEAISTMYGSVFFSILFFVMLITLGLDSTVSKPLAF